MSALSNILLEFIGWIFGWRSRRGAGSIIGVGVSKSGQVELDQVLPAEGVLAYTLEDDLEWVYVVAGRDEEATAALHAEVDDNIWTFREDHEELSRRKKEVPPPDIGSSISSVARLMPVRGFSCVRVPKGKLLPIYKQVKAWDNKVKYKKISKYKVSVTENYCVYTGNSRDSCRIFYQNVKGRYKELTKWGTWKWTTRTRRLGKC